MKIVQPICHLGYLHFFENQVDLNGFKAAIHEIIPSFAGCQDPLLFAVEAEHLLRVRERIEELLSQNQIRIWHFGKSYTKRRNLRDTLIEARANLNVGIDILVIFNGKLLKGEN